MTKTRQRSAERTIAVGKLGDAALVDAPAITVEAPQVNVAVPADPAKTITIERHPSGLIKSATVEASA